MSALNKKETEALRHVLDVLRTVSLEGFDKDSEDAKQKWLGRELKTAYDEVRTVQTMKGHYDV